MNIRLELKVVVGILFALMLGGTVLADSVSIYPGNNVTDARDLAFGATTVRGWDQGINPCNRSLDGHFVRNGLEKRSGWSFTAGSHTVIVPAAEPATGLFVGLGLAVVGLMRRRRKKPLENAVWETLG